MSSENQKAIIRQRFIDAAKELLLSEGVENVSVRKVGNLCGCSYATIYNYFDNLDHLLWAVSVELLQDIIGIYDPYINQKNYRVQELTQMFKEYVRYYLKNPNVFRFFFYYHLEPDGRKEENNQMEVHEPMEMKERPHLEAVLQNILKNMEDKRNFEMVSVETVSSFLVNSMHGLLMMYFSKRRQMTEEDLFRQLEQIIEFTINNNNR